MVRFHFACLSLVALLLSGLSGCSCIVNPDREQLGPGGDADVDANEGDADVDADEGVEDGGPDGDPDADPDTGPDACGDEVCNGRDDDCDGVTDEAGADNVCTMCDGSCGVPGGTAECEGGECSLNCEADSLDCDGDLENGCERTLSDEDCGCGNTCDDGEFCDTTGDEPVCSTECGGELCDGTCVDTDDNPSHCGECGNSCEDPTNASGGCNDGACGISSCAAGFGDCDGELSNGCETNVFEDLTSCGTCGMACAFPNAAPKCEEGACGIADCEDGFADCNGVAADGCEVMLGGNTQCTACGDNCTEREGAVGTCGASGCEYQCAPGRLDCDGDLTADDSNGCEVDSQSDTDNCGTCDNDCAPGVACESGSCATIMCPSGELNCDEDDANGCEVDSDTDPMNCGGCGVSCDAPNATGSCSSSMCSIVCNDTHDDCDSDTTNGCEVELGTTSNCRSCGDACSFDNATALCGSSGCELGPCSGAFGDCDGDAGNGCETNTTNTLAHCGDCGQACSLPNATTSCSSGMCQLDACNAPFDNCDGDASNGCETNTDTSMEHCGACGDVCRPPSGGLAECVGGVCEVACRAGLTLCGGECVDTTTSASHCGVCDMACGGATPVCSGSMCIGSTEICDRLDNTGNDLVDESLFSRQDRSVINGDDFTQSWPDQVRGDHALGRHEFGVIYRVEDGEPLRFRVYDAVSNSWSGADGLGDVDDSNYDICATSTGYIIIKATSADRVRIKQISYTGVESDWASIPPPPTSNEGGTVWDGPDVIRCERFETSAGPQVVIIVESNVDAQESLFYAVVSETSPTLPTFRTLLTAPNFRGHELVATPNGFAMTYIRRMASGQEEPRMAIYNLTAAADPTTLPASPSVDTRIGEIGGDLEESQAVYVESANRVVTSWLDDDANEWLLTIVDATTGAAGMVSEIPGRLRLAQANEGATNNSGAFAYVSRANTAGARHFFRRFRIDGMEYGGMDTIAIRDSRVAVLLGADGDVAPDTGTRYLWIGGNVTDSISCD